jgi:predicted choloylglycine hydrolase
MEKVLPFYTFSGSHREIGRQYGETCAGLIRQNLNHSFERLHDHTGATYRQVLDGVLRYQPFVQQYAPFLDQEIQGIAEASGLSLKETYFLQLRAEMEAALSPKSYPSPGLECTSFLARHAATNDGMPLCGQNADLPAFFAKVLIVMEIISDINPSVLMVVPAGQVSYLGMNIEGLCAFANFVSCGGWRPGFPRYFLSRLALTATNVQDAATRLMPVQRASSRNVLLIDANGQAVDIEFAVERQAVIQVEENIFVHSNHFIAPELLDEERSTPKDLHNSKIRLERLKHLLLQRDGGLSVERLQVVLRDRETFPDTLSIEPGDDQNDYITITSIIAEPAKRHLWATHGPPSLNPYQRYTFSAWKSGERL